MEYCMILTTCPNEKEAKTLAERIILKKIAACVQLSPIKSFYMWKEKVCFDSEIRLFIKTKKSLYEELEQFIKTHHSYEIPQIVQVPIIEGLDVYLDWIDDVAK